MILCALYCTTVHDTGNVSSKYIFNTSMESESAQEIPLRSLLILVNTFQQICQSLKLHLLKSDLLQLVMQTYYKLLNLATSLLTIGNRLVVNKLVET